MAERTLYRLPPVAHQNIMSVYCTTLVIHLTCHERQRTLAVASLDSGALQVVVSDLEQFGAIWSHLEQFGAIRSLLEPVEACWSQLDPFFL